MFLFQYNPSKPFSSHSGRPFSKIIRVIMTHLCKETTPTCHNQQMTWHVAKHWRAEDFLLLIIGLVVQLNETGSEAKQRPANYTQVIYTCSAAPILKLTLSVIRHSAVTIAPQWFTADWNSALHHDLYFYVLNWGHHVHLLWVLLQSDYTDSKHPKQLTGTWHPLVLAV